MISDNLITIASFTPNSLQSPNGWVGHLPFAAWVIQEISPKIFVELGTHSGNSYFVFCQSVVEAGIASKCYAVDTWQGDEHAGHYNEEIFEKVNAHHQEYYAGFSRLLRMTFDDAATCFADESIDLLHIDGLHTYEAVRHDFETWLPKLAPGAVVMLHDINVRERNFGVWKLWEELKAQYPNNLEFMHSHGLGVLQLNNAADEKRLDWLQPNLPKMQEFKNYFIALGTRQLERFEFRELTQHASSLNHVISERNGQIVSLNQAVAERDGQIVRLNQAMADHDGQIARLNLAVAERDGQIARLNQAMAEHDGQIARLNQAVAERDGQIASLNQAVAERDGQIANLNQDLGERNNRLILLEKEVTEQNLIVKAQANNIDELQRSSSWRVTRPLRYVGRLWRKARDVRAVAFCQLKSESLLMILRKVLRVLRRDGLRGVKARVRQQYYLKTQVVSMPPMALGFALECAAIVRDLQGHYALAQASKGYTYIEPQRPVDFESRLAALDSAPLFSIVVPVYNTSPELLEAVLASVQSQWYPHWQLVLADDASSAEETRSALAKIHHPQIKLLSLEKNQGIAGATNLALEIADGDFIVFMDHDDELTVDCLYELACCIQREQPDYIYSDEDKITLRGEYSNPHFKPDWSPDTMMSTMFTCHVSCVRSSFLGKVGGLRSRYDGCQDWDFVLRVSEQTDRISHIPKVLYHWRIIPASIASDIEAKPYVLEASRRVREDALLRRGLAATVEPIPKMAGYFRVAYRLQSNPLVSIIIPTRDNEKVLRRCVDSILQRTAYRHFELVILDNGSVESGTAAYLQQLMEQDGITVIRHDAPFNFSELNNIGARAANGELLLFLNDDTEVLQEDWLERLGGFAQLAHVGAVGAKLLYPGQSQIQHAGILNLADGPGHAFLLQDCDSPGYYMRNLLDYNWLAVTGACLMVSREKFNAIKGFSEDLPVAYNDVDLCMRLHDAGFYNVVCQAVRLMHHESASRGLDHIEPDKMVRLKRERDHLYERNPSYFQYDPFHNPNLHPNGINFEVPA